MLKPLKPGGLLERSQFEMRGDWRALALLLALAGLLMGCGRGRAIVGGFSLEQFENNHFYLHKDGVDDTKMGGSIIEGIVLRIGWNERYIVAERRSFFDGDPNGWMIIDVRSGAISGPYGEGELRSQAGARGIQILTVTEAWEKL